MVRRKGEKAGLVTPNARANATEGVNTSTTDETYQYAPRTATTLVELERIVPRPLRQRHGGGHIVCLAEPTTGDEKGSGRGAAAPSASSAADSDVEDDNTSAEGTSAAETSNGSSESLVGSKNKETSSSQTAINWFLESTYRKSAATLVFTMDGVEDEYKAFAFRQHIRAQFVVALVLWALLLFTVVGAADDGRYGEYRRFLLFGASGRSIEDANHSSGIGSGSSGANSSSSYVSGSIFSVMTPDGWSRALGPRYVTLIGTLLAVMAALMLACAHLFAAGHPTAYGGGKVPLFLSRKQPKMLRFGRNPISEEDTSAILRNAHMAGIGTALLVFAAFTCGTTALVDNQFECQRLRSFRSWRDAVLVPPMPHTYCVGEWQTFIACCCLFSPLLLARHSLRFTHALLCALGNVLVFAVALLAWSDWDLTVDVPTDSEWGVIAAKTDFGGYYEPLLPRIHTSCIVGYATVAFLLMAYATERSNRTIFAFFCAAREQRILQQGRLQQLQIVGRRLLPPDVAGTDSWGGTTTSTRLRIGQNPQHSTSASVSSNGGKKQAPSSSSAGGKEGHSSTSQYGASPPPLTSLASVAVIEVCNAEWGMHTSPEIITKVMLAVDDMLAHLILTQRICGVGGGGGGGNGIADADNGDEKRYLNESYIYDRRPKGPIIYKCGYLGGDSIVLYVLEPSAAAESGGQHLNNEAVSGRDTLYDGSTTVNTMTTGAGATSSKLFTASARTKDGAVAVADPSPSSTTRCIPTQSLLYVVLEAAKKITLTAAANNAAGGNALPHPPASTLTNTSPVPLFDDPILPIPMGYGGGGQHPSVAAMGANNAATQQQGGVDTVLAAGLRLRVGMHHGTVEVGTIMGGGSGTPTRSNVVVGSALTGAIAALGTAGPGEIAATEAITALFTNTSGNNSGRIQNPTGTANGLGPNAGGGGFNTLNRVRASSSGANNESYMTNDSRNAGGADASMHGMGGAVGQIGFSLMASGVSIKIQRDLMPSTSAVPTTGEDRRTTPPPPLNVFIVSRRSNNGSNHNGSMGARYMPSSSGGLGHHMNPFGMSHNFATTMPTSANADNDTRVLSVPTLTSTMGVRQRLANRGYDRSHSRANVLRTLSNITNGTNSGGGGAVPLHNVASPWGSGGAASGTGGGVSTDPNIVESSSSRLHAQPSPVPLLPMVIGGGVGVVGVGGGVVGPVAGRNPLTISNTMDRASLPLGGVSGANFPPQMHFASPQRSSGLAGVTAITGHAPMGINDGTPGSSPINVAHQHRQGLLLQQHNAALYRGGTDGHHHPTFPIVTFMSPTPRGAGGGVLSPPAATADGAVGPRLGDHVLGPAGGDHAGDAHLFEAFEVYNHPLLHGITSEFRAAEGQLMTSHLVNPIDRQHQCREGESCVGLHPSNHPLTAVGSLGHRDAAVFNTARREVEWMGWRARWGGSVVGVGFVSHALLGMLVTGLSLWSSSARPAEEESSGASERLAGDVELFAILFAQIVVAICGSIYCLAWHHIKSKNSNSTASRVSSASGSSPGKRFRTEGTFSFITAVIAVVEGILFIVGCSQLPEGTWGRSFGGWLYISFALFSQPAALCGIVSPFAGIIASSKGSSALAARGLSALFKSLILSRTPLVWTMLLTVLQIVLTAVVIDSPTDMETSAVIINSVASFVLLLVVSLPSVSTALEASRRHFRAMVLLYGTNWALRRTANLLRSRIDAVVALPLQNAFLASTLQLCGMVPPDGIGRRSADDTETALVKGSPLAMTATCRFPMSASTFAAAAAIGIPIPSPTNCDQLPYAPHEGHSVSISLRFDQPFVGLEFMSIGSDPLPPPPGVVGGGQSPAPRRRGRGDKNGTPSASQSVPIPLTPFQRLARLMGLIDDELLAVGVIRRALLAHSAEDLQRQLLVGVVPEDEVTARNTSLLLGWGASAVQEKPAVSATLLSELRRSSPLWVESVVGDTVTIVGAHTDISGSHVSGEIGFGGRLGVAGLTDLDGLVALLSLQFVWRLERRIAQHTHQPSGVSSKAAGRGAPRPPSEGATSPLSRVTAVVVAGPCASSLLTAPATQLAPLLPTILPEVVTLGPAMQLAKDLMGVLQHQQQHIQHQPQPHLIARDVCGAASITANAILERSKRLGFPSTAATTSTATATKTSHHHTPTPSASIPSAAELANMPIEALYERAHVLCEDLLQAISIRRGEVANVRNRGMAEVHPFGFVAPSPPPAPPTAASGDKPAATNGATEKPAKTKKSGKGHKHKR